MNRRLEEQLRQLGLDSSQPPASPEAWQALLDSVDQTYDQADRERDLARESSDLSAGELQHVSADLRRSRAKLSVERERLLSMVEHLGEALCLTDESGLIVLVNPEATRLLRGTPEELLGRPLAELFPSEERLHLTQARREEQQFLLAADGSPIEVAYNLRPIQATQSRTDAAEVSNAYVLVFRDVSELQLARRSALEAARLKDQFLANVSHEIRTPMNSILGFSEMLRGEEHLTERAKTHLDSIQDSGEQLLALLNNILDLSKLQSDTLPTDPASVDLESLLHSTVASVQPAVSAKGLRLNTAFPEDLPRTLRTDPQRLRQICSHLLDNAIKFTPRGRIDLCISLDPSTRSHLLLHVTDTGIGIDPDHHEWIFEPFRQSDASLTRSYGGAGLGLTLARELARKLGGDLFIDSALGHGSTFTLRLPLGFALPEPKSLPQHPAPTAQTSCSLHRPLEGNRILLASRHPQATIWADHLRDAGAELELTTTAASIRTRLESTPPIDVALFDAVLEDEAAPATQPPSSCSTRAPSSPPVAVA